VPNRRLAALLVLAPLALPAPALAHIRLAGVFAMTGQVTAARAVPGEYVGQPVTRAWSFVPLCPAGQCQTEQLVRSRATGGDKTNLRRPAGVFSRWSGKGSFFAPLACGSRLYPLGERVFFKIHVQITGATLVNGAPVATSVKATYQSYRRTNRTRCVSALGRDAAVYTGTLVTPPPPPPPAPAPAPPAGQSGPTPAPG
jgi:hypothetical protein